MQRARSKHCQGHGHPGLQRPIPREQVREELRDLQRRAGIPGPLSLTWDEGLGRTHERSPRRYAQVAPFARPAEYELAPQVVYLPARNRRALLAHEVGHVLAPHAGEDGADAAARRALGIEIGYDRRWPGKGLQVQANPPPGWARAVLPYVSPRERPLSRREAHVREVAIALKRAAPWAIAEAAAVMAPAIPRGAVIVPAPGSSPGSWSGMRQLADELARRTGGVAILAVTRASPVPSSRAMRQAGGVGLSAADHGATMSQVELIPAGVPVVLVDNVLVTGATFEGMRRALGLHSHQALGLAYAQGRELGATVPVRRNADPRIRELERAAQLGGPQDKVRWMAAAERAGRLPPQVGVPLWLLARANHRPEVDWAHQVFGHPVPIAKGWEVGGTSALADSIKWRAQDVTSDAHLLLYELLSGDVRDDLAAGRPIPVARILGRYAAWVEVLNAARKIMSAQGVGPSAAEDLVWDIGQAADVASLHNEAAQVIPRMQAGIQDEAQVATSFLGQTRAVAGAIDSIASLLYQSGAFGAVREVPESWWDDCFDDEYDELDQNCLEEYVGRAGSKLFDWIPETTEAVEGPRDNVLRIVGRPDPWITNVTFYNYIHAVLVAHLRGWPVPAPPRAELTGYQENPPRRNPPHSGDWKVPPPCDTSKAAGLKHRVPLGSLVGQRVRVHVNLHNGCYVVSHKGRVAGYTKGLKLKNVIPKVSEAGWRACNTTKVRNVHAYIEGELVAASAKKPGGRGWQKITYRCKEHGPCFYYPSTGKTFEGAGEVVFLNKGGKGFAQIEVLAKGRPVKANPSCCGLPGGACRCGAVQAWWREPPPGRGC